MIGIHTAAARRWGGRVAAVTCAVLAATGLGGAAAMAVPSLPDVSDPAPAAAPAVAPAPNGPVVDLAEAAESAATAVVKPDAADGAIGTGPALDGAARELAMEPHPVAEDPVSKILGATPGPVHNRVDGVWFPSPTAPAEAERLAGEGRALVGPGTPILVGDGDARNVCTLAAAGRDAGGRLIGLTAGHCGATGAPVRSMDAVEAGVIGTVQRVDATYDYAVLVLGGNAVPTSTYGDTRVTSVGDLPKTGETACKQGVATGRTCGPTWVQGAPGSASDPHVSTQICAAPGDSGAPVFVGERLVGMIKGANSAPACVTPLQGPAFAPTIVTSVRAQIDDMNLHGGPGGGFQLA